MPRSSLEARVTLLLSYGLTWETLNLDSAAQSRYSVIVVSEVRFLAEIKKMNIECAKVHVNVPAIVRLVMKDVHSPQKLPRFVLMFPQVSD